LILVSKYEVIWDFVGDTFALQVVAKYDAKIVYPLLVLPFEPNESRCGINSC
jgi:hypothetical protein